MKKYTCLLLCLLIVPLVLADEKNIYALKTNQFYITDKIIESWGSGSSKEQQQRTLHSISNIHIDSTLASRITEKWGESNKAPNAKQKEQQAELDQLKKVSNCISAFHDSAEDAWAIVCLNDANDLLSNQDQKNFHAFSQLAEIVKAKIYSNEPVRTEAALKNMLLAAGVSELIADHDKLACIECLPYAVLRSFPFK